MIQLIKIISPDYLWKRLLVSFIVGLFGFCILTTIGLSGCSTSEEKSGKIVIGLTDDEGDFVSYTVDVLFLTLTKSNGAVVNTLPLSTRVDFAQYTEMTEFLTAATVPSGAYTKATLILDYKEAEIAVEDANGNAVEVESILDVNGNPITTLEVSVHLKGTNYLLIAPGIPSHLTLDFNLTASNKVEFSDSGSPVLTVQPVLLADVNAEAPKIHRLRGPLKEVDVDEGTFEVIIRPFIHIISGGDDHFGILEVTTNNDTVFEINEDVYQGQVGLNALNEMPILTATVVIGDLKFNPPRFEAHEVYAGSRVPGGELDVVTGNVIKRNGNVLTVKGATLIRTDGSVVFNDTVTIQLGENTKVGRQLSLNMKNISDISVGQRVTVFGTLNIDNTELDATEGYVRILLTTLRGTVVATDTPWFVINLNSIDRRRVSIFDFSGTGINTENDTNPANYEIDAGSLDVSSIPLDTPIKVRGFVNAFGQAPEDFDAQTVVGVSNVAALIVVDWFPASTTAFEDLTTEGIKLNLEGVGLFHHLNRAGVVIDLTKLPDSPWIQPREGGLGLFSIAQSGAHQFYFTFENFVIDLNYRLTGTVAVKHIIATGFFDDGTATLTAGYIAVKLK